MNEAPGAPEVTSAPTVEIGGRPYDRLLIRTPLINPDTDLDALMKTVVKPHVTPSDVVFISEKVVAITQGRLLKGDAIRVRPLAQWVARRVRRSKHGMGHRNPLVMEMAMREAGSWRILLAAAVGGVTRKMGRSGDFYRVAGRRVAAIDGTNPVTIPPYGDYVILMPLRPARVARRLSEVLGVPVAVVDANDVGVEVLGASPGVDRGVVLAALGDNPMGQGHERTPVGIVRPRREKRGGRLTGPR